ncbi:ABC transporter ATP-binding protein [Paracoccaceae bacterium]|nr:ABC transporter ATP-binding protein [Paracoccaceae bacterium]
MSHLKLTGIRKSFGKVDVIEDVNLDISSKEFVVFVGPSGCGKSTLLRMIAGLEEISAGELFIDGSLMNNVDASKRGIAMVFQSYALYPHMTVKENMGFALKYAGAKKDEIIDRVAEVAKVLELDQLLDRKPKDLSGGQRQRVAIGRAIVRHPDVFLFDEPLSNLDAELRVQMRIEIARLHKELQTTIIYVTHDQVEAMTLADKIVVLKDGKIEQVGAPLSLYDDPVNQFVAGFIGSPKMNFLPARVEDGLLYLEHYEGQFINLPKLSESLKNGTKVVVGIRPEHFSNSGGSSLSLKVEIVEHLGGETYAYASNGNAELITIAMGANRNISSGEEIEARFDTENALLFDNFGARIR